jgi:uncharacterized GH25 family protein
MTRIFITLAAILAALPAWAHEFWIEPVTYRVAPGETIEARTFNGEHFGGIEYGYSKAGYQQSGVVAGADARPIPGENGDKPAISTLPAGEGLNVLFHASAVSTLTYPTMGKFEHFIKGKRLDWVLEVHKERRLPDEDIREAYFRFVKALVAVGDGAGSDRLIGMPYELLALDNPYTDAGDIRFRVYLNKQPVGAGVPVFVFHKTGERGAEPEKIELTTDAAGEVTVPRMPGDFMVNAVHITEPSEKLARSTRADWVTLWAASNYRIEN